VVTTLEVVLGDITGQKVDAIVNAANTSLLGGGGVDRAIHRAAGRELLDECRTLGGCPTGEARITKGYRLSAKYVIHTVGPVWRGGEKGEDDLLRSCYSNALKLADANGVRTIAFPAISTGAYGFPTNRASKIAVASVREYMKTAQNVEKVIFVCFTPSDYALYRSEIEE
jgi:O-acetyl-ADP-ribose deacetylase (regulator of RNase III)